MPAPSRTLRVADSFRVRDTDGVAEVRGFAHHLDRFTAAVLAVCDEWADVPECTIDDEPDGVHAIGLPEYGVPEIRAALPAFLDEARERIADYGQGFPRLELWRLPNRELALDLALRPLPTLTDTILMRSAGAVRLQHPDRKGPNIAVLGALNRELGAEVLLQDAAGNAVEGATTSIVYWPAAAGSGPAAPSGGRSGHVVATAARVPSVTEALLRAEAGRPGAPYSLTARTPSIPELQAAEVWAVNALHGIRQVTHLDGVSLPAPFPGRLAWFRAALDRRWSPVLGSPDRAPTQDPAQHSAQDPAQP